MANAQVVLGGFEEKRYIMPAYIFNRASTTSTGPDLSTGTLETILGIAGCCLYLDV